MPIKTQATLTILTLMTATLLITVMDLDRETARLFYAEGSGFASGDRLLWRTLYRYGEWPALLLAGGALLGLIAGFFRAGLRRHRRACVFLLLVYLLGPGLLVNGILKNYWDRPRPLDVVDFGGSQPFVQLHAPTFAGAEGRSFPSGHASVAFYLATPWFLLRSTNRRAARAWLGAGLAYGCLMGLTRMVQGAHFLTDIVWSWGLLHLLGLLLTPLLGLDEPVPVLTGPHRAASTASPPVLAGWAQPWFAALRTGRAQLATAVHLLRLTGSRGRRLLTGSGVAGATHHLVKLAVSVALILLIGRSVDLHAMAEAVAAIPPPMLAAALALQLASNCVAAGRWRLIMRRIGVPGSFAFYLRSFFKGALFNQGLPTSIGGDGLRILDAARVAAHGEDAVFGVFIDRVIGLTGLLLLNIAALLLNRALLPDWVVLPLLGVLTLFTTTLAGLFFLARIDLFQRGRVLGFLGRLSNRYRQVLSSTQDLTLQTGLSLLTHLLAMGAFAMLGSGAGLHYPLQVYLALVPPAVLLTILPVSLAGWGIREGAMVGLFLLVGADKSAVLTFSITYGLVNLIASLPGLPVYLVQRHRL